MAFMKPLCTSQLPLRACPSGTLQVSYMASLHAHGYGKSCFVMLQELAEAMHGSCIQGHIHCSSCICHADARRSHDGNMTNEGGTPKGRRAKCLCISPSVCSHQGILFARLPCFPMLFIALITAVLLLQSPEMRKSIHGNQLLCCLMCCPPE